MRAVLWFSVAYGVSGSGVLLLLSAAAAAWTLLRHRSRSGQVVLALLCAVTIAGTLTHPSAIARSWFSLLAAGVHMTIAGALLGLLLGRDVRAFVNAATPASGSETSPWSRITSAVTGGRGWTWRSLTAGMLAVSAVFVAVAAIHGPAIKSNQEMAAELANQVHCDSKPVRDLGTTVLSDQTVLRGRDDWACRADGRWVSIARFDGPTAKERWMLEYQHITPRVYTFTVDAHWAVSSDDLTAMEAAAQEHGWREED